MVAQVMECGMGRDGVEVYGAVYVMQWNAGCRCGIMRDVEVDLSCRSVVSCDEV